MMQSDDFFVRKYRLRSPRPSLTSASFDPMRDARRCAQPIAEWPPKRDEDGMGEEEGNLTPSRVGLKLRPTGRNHVMQRRNSDVTPGGAGSSGRGAAVNAALAGGGERAGLGVTGTYGAELHREYGSLSSLEEQTQTTQGQAQISQDQSLQSPAAQRFKDPFLLLGLPATDPNPDNFFRTLSAPAGDLPKPAKPQKPELLRKKSKLNIPQPGGLSDGQGGCVWVRSLAHYDVQSILFDLAEVASNRNSIGRKKNISSGASAASQLQFSNPDSPPSPSQSRGSGASQEDDEQSLGPLDEGDGNDNDMLLSCPHFCNETGGEERVGLGLAWGPGGVTLGPQSPNDAISVLEEPRKSQQERSNYFIEHTDLGALYYRKYFYNKGHQNFFGIDDRFGPLAISFRREEKENSSGSMYNYRIIFRTTELKTMRGSVLEETVSSAARHANPRGLSPKRLLEHIFPELNLHCLRLASTSPKVQDTLLKLDEQGLNFQRKVGVMYCKAGQSSEEDMYNNESAGPAFDEFLDLLGERVRLQGFEKYRAQLDIKTDSTGTHSLYTRYQDYEIMFHVTTMLPYTAKNTQQLLRKRHIGNDIVTIVFQEPGALPFTPKVIRSHFQHVFIIVQVHNPCTDHTYYRVAVTRSKDIPLFGPLFPRGARFPRSPAFRDFLLAKVANAECAAEKSEKFRSMATRTRQEYLKDLAENCVTTTPLDHSSSKFPLLNLGGKRKDKLKGAKGVELHSGGALVWTVTATGDGAADRRLPCLLAVSSEYVVLIDRATRSVVFNCCCRDVFGWKAVTEGGTGDAPYLDIFYDRGQSVSISLPDGQAEDIREVVQRLELVTTGCEAWELTPLRDGVGQPGFRLSEEGFVLEVETYGYAARGGLRRGSRVVRLCGRPLVSLAPEERAALMRTAPKIQLTVIPPDKDGKPRRSFLELYQKANQDVECKVGEGPPGEAWVIDERDEEAEGEREQGKGKEAVPGGGEGKARAEFGWKKSLLPPSGLPLLRATSLQDGGPPVQPAKIAASSLTRSYSSETCQNSVEGHIYDNLVPVPHSHIYENVWEMHDSTPDLIQALSPKVRMEDEELQKQFLGVEHPLASDPFQQWTPPAGLGRADRSSRARSIQKSITRILSENSGSIEEEWQSINELNSATLEALSREEHTFGEEKLAAGDRPFMVGSTESKLSQLKDSDSPGHLEDKVSQLESTLKKLQDDLQKEQKAKAALQAEVQSLRQNNERLQEESQSTVARLIKVTELLCKINKPC